MAGLHAEICWAKHAFCLHASVSCGTVTVSSPRRLITLMVPTDASGPTPRGQIGFKTRDLWCCPPSLLLSVLGRMISLACMCASCSDASWVNTTVQVKARGEKEEIHHASGSSFGKRKARMLFLFSDCLTCCKIQRFSIFLAAE